MAAAGALTAFMAGGLSIAAATTAFADDPGDKVPGNTASCPLPLLPCDLERGLQLPDLKLPNPLGGTQEDSAEPRDSRSQGPEGPPQQEQKPEDHPWKPVDENEHQVPQGHPETGGGWLASGTTTWPVTVGGVALLAGVGLTGVAVRRRKVNA